MEFLYWHRLKSEIVTLVLKLLDEDVFITRTVKDIVWGYQDEMLKLGHELDPVRFYTDIAGVLAKVSMANYMLGKV